MIYGRLRSSDICKMKNFYKKFVKTFFDFVLGFVILIILFPLFLTISFFIYLSLGRPVLFIQERGGFKNSIFKLYKFRTMTNQKNSQNILLPAVERLTKFGKFLRKTSLDELPSLINILKGEMSFIGPRPFIKQYLDIYTKDQKRRHLVKPGITGLAQVNGRNNISWDQKFKYDIYYVDNISIILDLKILFKTFIVVIKQKNISEHDEIFKNTNK